jgi:hypothetical protein
MHPYVKFCIALIFALSLPLFAQKERDSLTQTILHEDGAFWDAYNRCDVEKMSQFFWPDIEFYHDKGGPTIGLGPFTETLKTGLCGKLNFRLRREEAPETSKVFPLQKNGVTYGAVLSGEHYFYINDSGKPEYRDGMAKFFHVWMLKNGKWKMARVVSYDHHEAPYENKRKEVTLAPEVLERYVGKYNGSHSGSIDITRSDNQLILALSGNKFVLHPESENVFFSTERDLTFEFLKEGAQVSRMIVRERGSITEELKAE